MRDPAWVIVGCRIKDSGNDYRGNLHLSTHYTLCVLEAQGRDFGRNPYHCHLRTHHKRGNPKTSIFAGKWLTKYSCFGTKVPLIGYCLRGTENNAACDARFPKTGAPRGIYDLGLFFLGGTSIFINLWSMAHDKGLFSLDVKTFRSERSLESSEEERASMMKTTDAMFGHGRW